MSKDNDKLSLNNIKFILPSIFRDSFITPVPFLPSLPLTPLQLIDWLKKVSSIIGCPEAIEESIQQIEAYHYIEQIKREKQGEGINECTPLLGYHPEE